MPGLPVYPTLPCQETSDFPSPPSRPSQTDIPGWLQIPAKGSPVLPPLLAVLLQKGLSASLLGWDGFLGTVASGTIYPLPKALELPQSMFKKPPLCGRPCWEPKMIHRE